LSFFIKRLLFSLAPLSLVFVFVSSVHAAAVGDCSQPSFNVAPQFGTEVNPNAVAVGDFNSDGLSDLVSANYGSGSLSIFYGDGEGAFEPPKRLPVGMMSPSPSIGSSPRDVEVSDLNGDGKLDLVAVGGYASGWVSSLLGDGAGNFTPAGTMASTTVLSFAVGDFNGDGKKDLSLVGGESKVSFLLGNGLGHFSPAGNRIVNIPANAITVGDFNGDTISDVAVTGNGWKVSVILGNNSGAFTVNNSFPLSWGPFSITAADFNGDSKTDLAVTISWSTPNHFVAIMLNDGVGNFGPAKEIFVGFDPLAVIAGEFNGDGKMDLAITVSGANSVAILTGNGLGDFAAPKYFGTADGPSSLAAGDFNKDGKSDLVVAHFNTNAIAVLLGDGGGAFATTRTQLAGGAKLASADFNGDGRPDLAISSNLYDLPSVVGIYLNNGAGTLSEPFYYQINRNPASILVDDLNHDGKADLIIGHGFSQGLTILLGNGAGRFSAPTNIAAASDSGVIAGGDFNGDNNLDVVMFPANTNGTVALMLGNGAGGFGAPVNISSVASLTALTAGDFNGDGKLDLAMTNGSSMLFILLGNGSGGFSEAPYSSIHVGGQNGYDTIYVTSADLNKDGRTDLITSNTQSSTLSILLNNGSGFQSPTKISPGASPGVVRVEDFNTDGNPDLAMPVRPREGNIYVLSGDGAGNFTPPSFFVAGGAPNDLTAADFNGDSKPDLAVAGTPTSTANTTILLNTFKPQPCLNVEDVQIMEGNSGTSNLVFNVSLSAAQSQAVKVNYFLKDNTAKSGLEYQPVSGRLVFAPGVTQQTVAVPIIGDTLDEVDKGFYLRLANPANAAIGRGQATGMIVDDDPEPTISIDDVSVREGNSPGSSSAVFTLSLSAPSTKQINVSFTVVKGTATTDDYINPLYNYVIIPPGTAKGNIYIMLGGDVTYEPDETLSVNLINPVNATIDRGQGHLTILNDDPAPTISITNMLELPEGTSDENYAHFLVRLTTPSYQTITVNYATADGTALAGRDYVALAGTLTFNTGETEKILYVPIVSDDVDETDETVIVNLSNPVNATINNNQATSTIFDDDGPAITINDVTVTEGDTGTVNATFTVSLSAPSPQDVYVVYSTSGGTATSGTDYRRAPLTILTIPAGAISGTITIAVNGDSEIEPDETFSILLSSPTAGTNGTIADAQAICTIKDDDAQPSSLHLILDETEPNQAAAIDATSFLRDPFPVVNAGNLLNPDTDKNTRIIVFVMNLQLGQDESSSAAVVHLTDAHGLSYETEAEDVRIVPLFNFTQVRFRLPDNLSPGTCTIKVKANGQESNSGTIRIKG
jgi:hypothetical protein